MKKPTLIVLSILLTTPVLSFAASTSQNQLQFVSQEQVMEMYQARLDPDGTPELLKAMQQNQFSRQNMVRIQTMLRDAYGENLPTEPLMNKVQEGIAKSIGDEAIVRAVERVQKRYEYAYSQAETFDWDREQIDLFGALLARTYTAGFNEQQCEQILAELKIRIRTRSMNRDQSLQLAVATMTTARIMAHRRVRSATISALLTNALQKSYQARDMHTLQTSFTNQARHGSAEIIAQQFSNDITTGMEAQQLGGNSPQGEGLDNTVKGGLSSGRGGAGRSSDSGGSGGDKHGDGSGGSGGSSNSGGSGNSKGGSGNSGSSGSGAGNSGNSAGKSGSGSGGAGKGPGRS